MSECPTLKDIQECVSYHPQVAAVGAWLQAMVRRKHDVEESVFSCPRQYMGVAPPTERFLYRLVRYAHCSKEVFIHVVVYILRFVQRMQVEVSQQCVHRLLVAAFVVAIKHLDDSTYANTYYAKVCGVSLQELNLLEREFLIAMDFDVLVSHASYSATVRCLECSATPPPPTAPTAAATTTAARTRSPATPTSPSELSMGYTSYASSDDGRDEHERRVARKASSQSHPAATAPLQVPQQQQMV